MRYLRLFSANVKIAGKFIGDIEFAPITVFCGSNASGKTMLLNFIFQNLFNEYFDDNFESNNFKKFLEKNPIFSKKSCKPKPQGLFPAVFSESYFLPTRKSGSGRPVLRH